MSSTACKCTRYLIVLTDRKFRAACQVLSIFWEEVIYRSTSMQLVCPCQAEETGNMCTGKKLQHGSSRLPVRAREGWGNKKFPGKTPALQPLHGLCLSLQTHCVPGKVTSPEESNLLEKQVAGRMSANSSVKQILLDSPWMKKHKF